MRTLRIKVITEGKAGWLQVSQLSHGPKARFTTNYFQGISNNKFLEDLLPCTMTKCLKEYPIIPRSDFSKEISKLVTLYASFHVLTGQWSTLAKSLNSIRVLKGPGPIQENQSRRLAQCWNWFHLAVPCSHQRCPSTVRAASWNNITVL